MKSISFENINSKSKKCSNFFTNSPSFLLQVGPILLQSGISVTKWFDCYKIVQDLDMRMRKSSRFFTYPFKERIQHSSL